jgi:sugar phosphate isomerase/epimerase
MEKNSLEAQPMANRKYSRRETMKVLAAVSAFAVAARPSSFQSGKGSVRLGGPIALPGAVPAGIGAGNASSPDPVELARAARKLGYRAIACPQMDLKDKKGIRAIEEACKAEDVVIAEVTAFGFNMMARDSEERKQALDSMCEKMALADEVGARCCVNIAGYRGSDAKNRQHPENLNQVGFDMTVENVRRIVDMVKPKRAKFALEAMSWIIPDGPDSYLELIRAVDRSGFGVHFDPVNLINSPRRHFENGKFLEECFAKIGKWIVSCHAKDTLMTGDSITHINEGRPGTGILDWKTFLRGVAALQQNPPIMMEHLKSQEEYLQARDFIFAQGKEIGISF